MTEQERKNLVVRVKNNKYLTRSETDYIVNAIEEVQKYHDLEQKLNGVDLVMLVNHWMEMAAEGEVQGYQRGRVLTNEDADQWDAYKEIGTPEECRAAVEKQQSKRPTNSGERIPFSWYCPSCKCELCDDGYKDIDILYCPDCGQKLDWSDEE